MSIFDVKKQLTFYGAYHNNPTNVSIHMLFVPTILWSAQVFLAFAPVPSFFPQLHYKINDYLEFDLNWTVFFMALYLAYYYALEPVAAFLYTPQMILSVLSAIAFAHKPDALNYAIPLHVVAWIAQFAGHGLAEKRSPALLDNLIGAIVLAPFFVHLELLFKIGYRPDFHKALVNDIGKEIARVKKIEGDKRRAAETKKEL
ncbi:DUF962-domain-containing protein [Panus rudis PR-1116 ss-1]|nr:DUF962-domain-containing protein [Panus rudis PR-1116 ss-1]